MGYEIPVVFHGMVKGKALLSGVAECAAVGQG